MRGRDHSQGLYFGADGGVHDERTHWNRGKSGSWRVLADHRRFPRRGRCILCAMVLVAAFMAGLSRRGGGWGTMAMDCSHTLRAWFRGGNTLHLGLRTDGTRNTGAGCSAEEPGLGGVFSVSVEARAPP